MIEAKKEKDCARKRATVFFFNNEKTDSNRLFYVPHKST